VKQHLPLEHTTRVESWSIILPYSFADTKCPTLKVAQASERASYLYLLRIVILSSIERVITLQLWSLAHILENWLQVKDTEWPLALNTTYTTTTVIYGPSLFGGPSLFCGLDSGQDCRTGLSESCARNLGWLKQNRKYTASTYWVREFLVATQMLRGINWVNEDAYKGSIRKFDLVLQKWELLRTVTLSPSEQFGWELPTVTWYVG